MFSCYKADGSDLTEILSLEKQRASVRILYTARPCDAPEVDDDKEANWDFEGIVTAGEVATSGIRGSLSDVQVVCENGTSLYLRQLLTSSTWLVSSSR